MLTAATMKRKKPGEIMSGSGWISTLLCFCGCVAVAGGLSLRKKDGKEPTAVGNLGYQWNVDSPRFKELVFDEETVPVRHLLNANETLETTASPPEEDKSIWEEIEEFYSDSNNMAMYCVLPLIVLVYGGCSAIYCIYKCRRYFRRRGKHKRLNNEDTSSVSGDERNDLNQEADSEGQPIKTVSGSTWEDNSAAFTDVGYNVQRKKTPLPWDTPQKTNQVQRQDSFVDNGTAQSRDGNYSSAGSRESTSMALEREREKLDRPVEVKPSPVVEDNRETPPVTRPPLHSAVSPREETTTSQPPQPRPLQIVPISQKEYQRQMEVWDPLHNRPFDSRASGVETERSRNGRESSWSIRDEIMAKYDALTSLAMAKKTADVLRSSSNNDPNMDRGHRPDTLRRKPGKKKLIFIAE
ncbi:uncharacterized protein LOC143288770 [Babylonia areolata]|uniref:uncharacterized protein LOC143288770 n=1 Tax=Babylonia areolata TaxID=304850 RepID=UPI003FD43E1A